jgi:FkbM family methyltransferase
MSAKVAAIRALQHMGIDVARRNPWHVELQRRHPWLPALNRATMRGALSTVAGLGLRPATVFDVGAAVGTTPLYAAFPHAHHVLIEPLDECASQLRTVAASLRHCDVFIGTAGATERTVMLNVHPDPSGSSLLMEHESGHVNGVPRAVEQRTLDRLADDFRTSPPYFLKLDTQGSELEVLRGAEQNVLPATVGVLVETSLFQFFDGGPLIADVIEYMSSHGFVIYDVVDLQYRPLDGALSQLDLLFVRSDDQLRARHYFATPRQREAANERQLRKFQHATRRTHNARGAVSAVGRGSI